MTNLEQLTAKIQKLVPEIMELKFGCKVLVKNSFSDFYNKTCLVVEKCDDYGNLTIIPKDYPTIGTNLKSLEILGRDITLEDVLKARLMQDGCPIKYNEAVEFDIGHDWENIMFFFRDMNWQLGLPLHQQSQETIDWLNQVIE